MDWPWHFRDVSEAEKAHRRIVMDRYGLYAQLSALIPIAGYWLYKLLVWVFHERMRTRQEYTAVPGSPGAKQFATTKKGKITRAWRNFQWWLDGENFGYGKRIHFYSGLLWFGWLLFLSVHRTGDDYYALTKRFGIIAASQLPLHYALIMRHHLSPISLLFRTSYERYNAYHRTLGRVIFGLLYLHVGLYWNAFIQRGVVFEKLTESVVLVGMLAFLMLNILGTTSLDQIRAWNYRVFFVFHVVIGVSIVPVLWFHAPSLRAYIIEAIALFVLDVGVRRTTFLIVPTHITSIPNTNLLSLTIPLTSEAEKAKYANSAGRHIFLQVPPESRVDTGAIADLCFNPFTIASVAPDNSSFQVVLRTLNGPTSHMLSALTKLPKADPPLQIEGPCGDTVRFPKLAREFDRVLLVAGGVGATFCLTIYRQIRKELEKSEQSSKKVEFVWSMRSPAEAAWANPTFDASVSSLSEEEGVRIFVTGAENPVQPTDGSIDLLDLARVASQNGDANPRGVAKKGGRRPNLKAIVDETFEKGKSERVAVLVCGPKSMNRKTRMALDPWVKMGRDVWYHEEYFGWE